jgi:hypothetical protein
VNFFFLGAILDDGGRVIDGLMTDLFGMPVSLLLNGRAGILLVHYEDSKWDLKTTLLNTDATLREIRGEVSAYIQILLSESLSCAEKVLSFAIVMAYETDRYTS